MKILVGTFEIGRHMHDLAAGFRALGHEVDTLAIFRNPQHPDLEYTYHLPESFIVNHLTELEDHPFDSLMKRGDELMLVRKLFSEYDLYVFQFASSLLPGNNDYPLLKQLGKRLACVFLGSDVRHWSGAQPVGEAYGMTTPDMLFEEPYSHLNTRLSNLRMAERHADAIFSLPFQSELAVRPYWHVQLPLDLSNYTCEVHDRDVPVIVHAPTRRNFKGTPAVLEALDRLREEGEQFELRLLENVPNKQVLKALTDADLVIDQLHAPHYGMLALEGMASGCAIVGGNNPDYVPFMHQSPVVHADANTVYDRVRALLQDRSQRRALAENARAYAEVHHDHVRVADTMLEKLELRAAYEYYPTFFATQYQAPQDGEQLHPGIVRITTEILLRHGLPADADPRRLVKEGLADARLLSEPLVRWSPLVANTKKEVWGWSPLHVTESDDPSDTLSDPESQIDRRALLVEAAMETCQRVAEGDVGPAASLFRQCIAEISGDETLLDDDNLLTALALAAMALGLDDEAAAFTARGLEHFPDSQSLRATARRVAAVAAAVEEAAEANRAA